jgi:hypothetical protein
VQQTAWGTGGASLLFFLRIEAALERRMSTETENRAARRRTTYSGGEIVVGPRTRIGCIVRDLSTKGAKLEIKFNAPPIPDKFDLSIPDVLKQSCRVVWREGRQIGVRFG